MEAIILIVNTLIANLDRILEAAFAIMQGLISGLLNALPLLIDALPQIIMSIVNFITENFPMIIDMGIQLTVQLAAGLIQAIPQLVAKLPEIIAAILGGLGKAVLSVGEIGINIIEGLWEGIKSMGSWIKDKVSDFFGGIVDGVKGLLGINSPSTVFADIGGNMGAGVGVGFTEAMKDIEKDMKKSIPTDFDIKGNIVGGIGEYDAVSSRNNTVTHTGTIRVEGVSDSGMLTGVVDIIMGELRREVRV